MSLEFDEELAERLSHDVCKIMENIARPTDWFRLELVYLAAGKASEVNLFGVWNHEIRQIDSVPSEIEIPLQELRRALYSPGEGTWFLARYYLEPDTTRTVVYDFDYNPNFSYEIDPTEWQRDLEDFPRDPQFQPKWLKEYTA